VSRLVSGATPTGAGEQPDYGEESYRGAGRREGRKALITGGDSGMGRAVALAFAREGAAVVIAHLPEEQSDAGETLRVVAGPGRKALALPGDLADASYCRPRCSPTRRPRPRS
jgi:NAD(P)-dependent dehydrogenase (short-subunit alcohol dehydrogenase family)